MKQFAIRNNSIHRLAKAFKFFTKNSVNIGKFWVCNSENIGTGINGSLESEVKFLSND